MLELVNYTVSLVGPEWFYKYNILLRFLFGIITLFIAYICEKAYLFTKDKQIKNFGLGFLFLSLSYFIISLSDLGIVTKIYEPLIYGINIANMFYLAHVFFHMLGLIIILLVSLKIKSKKIAMLIFSLILLFIAFSYQYFIKFHMVAFILLMFITLQYYWNLQNKKRKKFNSSLVFTSFYLMCMAEVAYFSTLYLFPSVYLLGNLFHFFGFILISYMLLRVLKNG